MLSMLTKIISLKDYRRNITKLWKEAQEKGVRYIVLHHSKPILDVRPYQEEEIVFDDDLSEDEEKKGWYGLVEKSWDFWLDAADDDIFDYNIEL
jgi:hypothetical protein